MLVKDFDGKEYRFPPPGHEYTKYLGKEKSLLHLTCRTLLCEVFNARVFLEEVSLPGTQLFFDFYLPFRNMAIEVQGEQHIKFIPHFHGNKLSFYKGKMRDEQKREWCRLNHIKLVELLYSEELEEWKRKIGY